MKIKIYKEFVGAVLFLGVSTVLWWLIPSQIELSKNAEAINSQTFPKMIVGLMWIASLILLGRELWRMVRQKPSQSDDLRSARRKSFTLNHWLADVILGTALCITILRRITDFRVTFPLFKSLSKNALLSHCCANNFSD